MSLLPTATIADIARHEGQTVALAGWVAHKTEKGKLVFIRLRDGSGLIQCVVFKKNVPEEVFAAAKSGEDPRCAEFAILWHRALAAATATSIHLEGPGKFYLTGMNARFVNVAFLNRCVQEMVKLSPLQSYVFEVAPRSDEVAIVGAAVNALSAGAR